MSGDRARPILCLVVDRGVARHPLTQTVAEAAAAGIDWIQLRDRTLEAAEFFSWGREIAEAARAENPAIQIIVNRRLDLALALEADGAHLGFDALSPLDARKLLGESAHLGISAHAGDEIEAALENSVSYAHLAPIFDPHSKPASRRALGLEPLRLACEPGLPVIAQGGIDAERCSGVIAAGAAGVAVTGAILQADQPGRATAELRTALDRVA